MGCKEVTQAGVRIDLYHLLCFSVGWLLAFWTQRSFIWRNYHRHALRNIRHHMPRFVTCLQCPYVIWTNKNISLHFRCHLGEWPCVWLRLILEHQTQDMDGMWLKGSWLVASCLVNQFSKKKKKAYGNFCAVFQTAISYSCFSLWLEKFLTIEWLACARRQGEL